MHGHLVSILLINRPFYDLIWNMSRASEAGSPTNRPGSDKTWGQGSFGLSTETNRTFDSPFLLRQGEPSTSQYITLLWHCINQSEHLTLVASWNVRWEGFSIRPGTRLGKTCFYEQEIIQIIHLYRVPIGQSQFSGPNLFSDVKLQDYIELFNGI